MIPLSADAPGPLVRRVSTSEAVVQHLLARIQSGEFRNGGRLPSERQLQTELGVGRLALREGLARLSALGVIRVEHGRGATVRTAPDSAALGQTLVPLMSGGPGAMGDLVAARALIEGELARLAAESDADLTPLEACLIVPRGGLPAEQLATWDDAFHREIARLAGNAFLMVMRDALASHIHAFLVAFARAQDDARAIAKSHRPIFEAIRDRDPARAALAARKHVELCRSVIERAQRLTR